jgi:hypothetical protein
VLGRLFGSHAGIPLDLAGLLAGRPGQLQLELIITLPPQPIRSGKVALGLG